MSFDGEIGVIVTGFAFIIAVCYAVYLCIRSDND